MNTATRCLLLASSISLLAACKKEAPTKTDLLTANNWRLTANERTVYHPGNTIEVIDHYAGFPDCDRDDFLKFNKNKTMVVDEGPTMCPPNTTQSYPGRWSFTPDENKLQFINATAQEFELVELTASTLKLKHKGVTTANNPYELTRTYASFK